MSWGSVIGGGFSLAGSLFGGGGPSRSDVAIANYQQYQKELALLKQQQKHTDKWNERAARHAFRQHLEARRQFQVGTNETVQRRVRDAKRAGLHPLYALGAPSISPSSAPAFGPAGSPGASVSGNRMYGGKQPKDWANIGRQVGNAINSRDPATIAAVKQQQARTAALHELELRERQSRIELNNAEAQMMHSKKMREAQDYTAQPSAALEGSVEVVPAEVISHAKGDPSVSAGKNPLWTKRVGKNGEEFWIPAQEVAEGTEGMVPSLMTVWKNAPAMAKRRYKTFQNFRRKILDQRARYRAWKRYKP